MDRQRVHIRAQPDAPIAAAFALDDPDNAGFADAGVHLVHAKLAQFLGNDGRGANLGKADLGMGMQVFEDCFELGLAVCDDGKNAHVRLSFQLCHTAVAAGSRPKVTCVPGAAASNRRAYSSLGLE